MHRLLIALLLGVASAALATAAGLLPFVQTIELKTYDARLAATVSPAAQRDDLILVTINDDSLQRLEPLVGRWPWPRLMHAGAIEFLARAGAKLVIYDCGPSMGADGTPAFPRYSFYDLFYAEEQILAGETPHLDPSLFTDRIVVVGATAQGLRDSFAVPFGEGEMPGPEAHAHILDGLLTPRAIGPAPWGTGPAVGLLVALAVSLAGAWRTAWVAGLVGLLMAGAWAWVSLRLFAAGTWTPLVVPLAAAGLAVAAEFGWQYLVEGREKRRVKRLFSRYVSKDVFDQLMADPSRAALGGTRREMTVLFSDVRGFTALSERGPPEAIVSQLNEYFSRMVDVVFANRGTVDKFVGDMVMALYGAPLDDERHADHAVATALAMADALEALNAGWAAEGRPTLDIGIGINTGEMVAGNIGSESIISYTVIGDHVNLAARLESLTREKGARIIISEHTRARLDGRYDIRPLGELTVKGRTQPVTIYQVVERPGPDHEKNSGAAS